MELIKPESMDLKKTKMFDVWDRHNLVRIDNLVNLGAEPNFKSDELKILAEKIKFAKQNGAAVVFFYGAHVIKSGLSRFIIDLIKKGYLTHIASNGAGSIHDFELAYLGGTSEDVPTAIEDGSFGMWEQTGGWMNEAINIGYKKGYGYGESLAHYVHDNPEKFKFRDDCVFYNAFLHGVPATYHISIGTDIIHQHPLADFSALGGCSGRDFAYITKSISKLENGVHMNVGSSVIGPEVFLKALSICRNQGDKLEKITTANFDILDLGDYKSNVSKKDYHYYYRPRKNVINRPVSLGGTGLYIMGDHADTIPTLYNLITK